MKKQILRIKARKIISEISEKAQIAKSQSINEKILQLINKKKPTNTIIFKPINNLEPLVDVLFKDIVRITNLYIIGNSKQNIKYYKLTLDVNENLIKNEIELLTITNIISDSDIIFVPGLLFTKDGNRLGKGGGWYDRFLSQIKCYKVGVCFKEQIVEDIPQAFYDILMDYIVSD